MFNQNTRIMRNLRVCNVNYGTDKDLLRTTTDAKKRKHVSIVARRLIYF